VVVEGRRNSGHIPINNSPHITSDCSTFFASFVWWSLVKSKKTLF
jgi:hypothetical protein